MKSVSMPLRFRRAIAVAALAVSLGFAAVASGQNYNEFIDVSLYGYLDQYSMNAGHNFVGNEACIPTSSTNALTYLQNAFPVTYGTVLSGSGYLDWKATDDKLITLMGTTAANGTYYNQFVYGLQNYLTDLHTNTLSLSLPTLSGMFYDAGWGGSYPKPDYITTAHPTAAFMAASLAVDAALLTMITYSGGGGHGILVNGLTWDSTTSTGTLSFIDPLDPSVSYSGNTATGPVLQTTGTLELNSSGHLKLTYDQYQGGLPYSPGNFQTVSAVIDGALAVSVPEPGAIVQVSAGLLAICLLRLRPKSLACGA